jgi:UDP-N-acetylglucosamine 2-epimerase (non-hydrolysing)
MIKTLFVFGTRPEAIKLCPVILHLLSRPEDFQVTVCVTAQHRAMLDQVLKVFGVVPDYDLDLMQPGQTLSQSTSRIIAALEPVIKETEPDVVLVQGDTTTTFCGALAAFYQRVPVAHVEAGLRTYDLQQPFPEELNRVMTSRIAALHFAATAGAAANLTSEGVDPKRVFITGNSGIDAVLQIRDRLDSGNLPATPYDWRDTAKRLILVTAHRRESFGAGIESICQAILRLAGRGDLQIVYPVHRNPHVSGTVYRLLENRADIHLIEPLEYVPFVELMRAAHILITDSGGVQEEGPSLGKPVLVTREKTERPEAVEAGTVVLVGPEENRIVEQTSLLLDNAVEHHRRSVVHNPYGDGHASERIAGAMYSFFR